MLIAQLSDLHVVAAGQLWSRRVDTNAMAAAAIARVQGLTPAPDLVLLTGDLVDTGAAAEYQQLAALLAPLAMPIYAIIGNHDSRDALRATPGPIRPIAAEGDWRGVVEGWPLRLVLVDSVCDGQSAGVLGPDRLAWIDARLTEDRRPTVLALHHPPFDTGLGGPDLPAEDLTRFGRLMDRHPHVERVLAGHIHRPVTVRLGHTIAMTAPSTAHQVAPRLHAKPTWWLEPPGFLLHAWNGERLISHLVPVAEPADGPYPFGA